MDPDLRLSMLRYYDERAPEYEEAYVVGTGTASIPDPQIFRTEAAILAGIVERCARGRLLDLACGSGYWLPSYARKCSHITLFDQSERMLVEGRAKVNRLGIADRCVFLQGDFFEQEFEKNSYDTVLAGFFLSHLTEVQERVLFDAFRTILDACGRFLILDSAWSPERAKHNTKVECQPRQLNDGTAFEIYKRYCDRDDISRWAREYGVSLRIEHYRKNKRCRRSGDDSTEFTSLDGISSREDVTPDPPGAASALAQAGSRVAVPPKKNSRTVHNQSQLCVLTRIKGRRAKDVERPVEFLQVARARRRCRAAREGHCEPTTGAILSVHLYFREGHLQRACVVERRIRDGQPQVLGPRRVGR